MSGIELKGVIKLGKKENLFKNFKDNADLSDINKIENELEGFERGKIKGLWSDVQSLYFLIKDPKTAWGVKAIAVGALMYLISPIDAIPDAIPIAGLADDAAIIIAAVASLGSELTKNKILYEREKEKINKDARVDKEVEKALVEKTRYKNNFKLISLVGVFAIIIILIIKVM